MDATGMKTEMGRYRWTICALLFFATTVNYLDRQVLSLLQPMLSKEFGWSNSDYADITSVFQFAYGLAVLFAGRFIDRVGTKRGYAWAIAVWSVGAAIHAAVSGAGGVGAAVSPALAAVGVAVPVSVAGFMVGRFVLAVGEAGNFPAAIKTVGEWFPRKERSLATGIFNSGANIGAVLAPLLVPWMAGLWGWQTAFLAVGAAGFVWLAFWLAFYDAPEKMLAKGKVGQAEYDRIAADREPLEKADAEKPADGAEAKVSWFTLLKFRQTWAFFFGKFFTDGVWWFFLFWLPSFLKAQYGMEGTEIMWPLGVLYSLTMVGSVCGGWFPAWFMKKGMEAYKARMTAMFVIALFPLAVLLTQTAGRRGMWFAILLIAIGCSAHQAWSANIYTTVSDMFPNGAVASITGIGTMAGSFSGVLVSKAAGALFDHYEKMGDVTVGYSIVFVYCAVAYLVAWCVMKSLVPRFAPVNVKLH